MILVPVTGDQRHIAGALSRVTAANWVGERVKKPAHQGRGSILSACISGGNDADSASLGLSPRRAEVSVVVYLDISEVRFVLPGKRGAGLSERRRRGATRRPNGFRLSNVVDMAIWRPYLPPAL